MSQSAVNGHTLPDNGNIDIGSGSNDMSALIASTRAMAASVASTGNLTLNNDTSAAQTIAIGTTNGLKIGTAAGQKIGFHGATPVIQGTSVGAITIAGTSQLADCNALKTAIESIDTVLRNHGLSA